MAQIAKTQIKQKYKVLQAQHGPKSNKAQPIKTHISKGFGAGKNFTFMNRTDCIPMWSASCGPIGCISIIGDGKASLAIRVMQKKKKKKKGSHQIILVFI